MLITGISRNVDPLQAKRPQADWRHRRRRHENSRSVLPYSDQENDDDDDVVVLDKMVRFNDRVCVL